MTQPAKRTQTDQNTRFVTSIHELNLLIARLFNAQVREFGLTRTQWMILYRLYQEGEQSQTQLANSLSMAKPPLGKVVDKLEVDGWVNRRQNPNDRRENLVSLTERVDPLIEPLGDIVAEISETALTTLDKSERDALVKLITVSQRNLTKALEAFQ